MVVVISYDISYDYLKNFMPHVSTKKLSVKIISELEKNLDIILVAMSGNQRKNIFRELLTKTERLMIAKRIAITLLVDRGLSAYKISEYLAISPSTGERFQRMHAHGRLTHTSTLIKKYKGIHRITTLIADLLMPFQSPRKSLNQLLKER
jgi:Trp operon repressor